MSSNLGNRGVWIAPWKGANGEMVLFALDSRSRLVGAPVGVGPLEDGIAIADRMWDTLTAHESMFEYLMGESPRFRRLRRQARIRRIGMGVIAGGLR